ncbi:uncharacterized protein LOC111272207 [Varroa jacobsoni]|uniref:uncharacterized protein LOC111272207 n=1 Tax=Varroa jacobsoni TaxID=62625 RepID=UPI000BF9BC04|nr:uncharacterized protein LOC111272207 [Varroa jacobsoni]XP_022709253.1 uncharacterized protein LOC111272207 [Varroa jacobsoni]
MKSFLPNEMIGFRTALLMAATLITTSTTATTEDLLVISARLEANEFLDNLLEIRLPKLLPDRAERLRDFSCYIEKKLFIGILPTHRDLTANFTEGTVSGLQKVKREGDCKPTFSDGNYVVISCKLNIGSLKATYASSVKGFNLRGDIAHPVITADFADSSLIFEAKEIKSAGSRPHMNALVVDSLRCAIHYESLGLNEERDQLLRDCITRGILPQILDLINIRLYRALYDALRQQDVSIPDVRINETTE